MHREPPPVVFLMGPTCTGKTALAVELVRRLPLEIVSVDSALVYRGLDIGTAKPGSEILAAAPHHLIDIRDPVQSYSAAEFAADARLCIQAIHGRGRIPLLVGGTGLYFRALERGLADLPAADPRLRAVLEAEARRFGWAEMHRRLATVDAASAARIHPNDPQRIQRALEVYELSGRPLSHWLQRRAGTAFPYRLRKLVLAPADRALLGRRIAVRFATMLEQGLVKELRGLRRRWPALRPALPAMRVVGYRQVWRHLEGELDAAALFEAGTVATRQLAKRQLTWLRAESGVLWLDCEAPDRLERVLQCVNEFALAAV